MIAAFGCSSYDPTLLSAGNNDGTAGTVTDGGNALGTAGTTAGTNMPTAGATAGNGGIAGTMADASVDGAMAGNGAAGTMPIDECYPNPDPDDQVCTQICPETCNNNDDDCDLRIDEQAPCTLKHADTVCMLGTCLIVQCDDDYRDCDKIDATGCEAGPNDINNCGKCGTKCEYVNGSGACNNGTCTPAKCDEHFDDCDEDPLTCEQSTEVNDHCGGCGIVCENVPHATPSCDGSVCGPGDCEPDYGDCDEKPGNGCEQLLNTNEHCGMCGMTCSYTGSDADCSTGVCLADGCDFGFAECSSTTTDGCESLNSPEYCGDCMSRCNAELDHVVSAECSDLACTITECEDGFGDCDGDPQTGCETELKNNTHCGACNTPCTRANTTATCDEGFCEAVDPIVCNAGFEDCDGEESNGCETSLNADESCGLCNNPCENGQSCSGGLCSAINCSQAPQNTEDCDGTRCGNCDSDDGDCETDLDSDENNCGTCNNVCAFDVGVTPHSTAPICTPSGCSITCDPGYADCDGNYKNGCEVALNTTSNCDGCGKTCAIANATSKCTTESGGHFLCEVDTCNANFADCDNNKTSCETAINTVTSCGACMNECNLANAIEACTGGPNWACSIDACQPSFKNCNGTIADGCEVDSRTDTANCGTCGVNCAMHSNVIGASCGSVMPGTCSYTCAANFKDCNSMHGCETDIRDVNNCGDCGTVCTRANATPTCSTGMCAIGTCNMGFGNCDMNDANGCEPLTTIAHCGACNTPCVTPNANGTCSTGTCAKTSCMSGWGDCNGGLDCERNINAPGPNETGGQGPCLPESNCVRMVHNNHEYYFCPSARTWSDARARCQLQRNGDLVRIDNDAENTFVRDNIGGDAWLGTSDTSFEGAWRWAWGTSQHWSGAAGGSAVGSLFNKWNTGEPNDVNGEDCAQIIQSGGSAGLWNDLPCTNTLRYVCEVQDDGCPGDTSKQHPGQCGCGTPDVHTDADGFADCVDGCPNDANKQSAGQCGCGVADVHTDADGVADCVDACPMDPNKSANAGQCGCGVADTDSDADGTADCNDTSINFNSTGIFTDAPSVSCTTAGSTTFSTSGAGAVTVCGSSITPVIRSQPGGPDLWILPMNSLTVASGVTLHFEGTRPAVIAVAMNATINGQIDANAVRTTPTTTPGAGGDVSCGAGTGQGANATNDADSNDGDGGGGGGGFGTIGGNGGSGNGGSSGAAGGVVNGNASLLPLRGGCRGGGATSGGNVNGGGAGGGAIQLSVGGTLTLSSTAIVSAAGSGGLKGGNHEDGGGGGGSGGAVLIEANALSIHASAWITAHGGGGAGGNETNGTDGVNGNNGATNSTTRAAGGAGGDGGNKSCALIFSGSHSDGGPGGVGATSAGASTVGGNGTGPSGSCDPDQGGGGGGGGGGVGRIRIRSVSTACGAVPTARVSPAATCP